MRRQVKKIKGGRANFLFLVRKSQVHKFLGPFRCSKSAIFLDVQVRNTKIYDFLYCENQLVTNHQNLHYRTEYETLKLRPTFDKMKNAVFADVLSPKKLVQKS